MQEGITRRLRLRPDEMFLAVGYGVLAACLAASCHQVASQIPMNPTFTSLSSVVESVRWSGTLYAGLALGVFAPWAWIRWRTQRMVMVFFDLSPKVVLAWQRAEERLGELSKTSLRLREEAGSSKDRAVRFSRGSMSGVRLNQRVWRVQGAASSMVFAPDGLWLLNRAGGLVRQPWDQIQVSLLGSKMNADDLEMELLTQRHTKEPTGLSHVLKIETSKTTYGFLCDDRQALLNVEEALKSIGARDTEFVN